MCCRQGLGSRIVPLDGPAQWQDFCSRESHPEKLLPVLPQYQISSWLGENAQRPARWMQCRGEHGTHQAHCSLPAEDLPSFVLQAQTCSQSSNAARGVLKPALCSGAGGVPRGCSPLPKCRQQGAVLGHQGLQKPSLMEEAAGQGKARL